MIDVSFMQLNMLVSIVLFILSLVIPWGVVMLSRTEYTLLEIVELMLINALFFNVGCLFFTGFMGQLRYGPEIAALLGWNWSPFQYELAFSELALAALGLLSPIYKKEFWLATILASSIWFFGGSGVHLYYVLALGSQQVLNASFVIGWNIFLALWLIGLFSWFLLICRCQHEVTVQDGVPRSGDKKE